MPEVKLLGLRFPAGGLVRRLGYQEQPPYTTPDCDNVRPYDVLEGRERGGRRPGLVKAYSLCVGGGNAIQLLADLAVVNSDGEIDSYLFGVAGGAPFLLQIQDGALVDSGVSVTGEMLSSTANRIHAVQRGEKLYLADPAGTPKVFDPSTGVVSNIVATEGTVPDSCPLVCRYRDRIVFAGPENLVYLGRAGDPLDWHYGALTDVGMAVMLSCAEAGGIGRPITALMGYGDEYLLIACEHSLWLLRGDPAQDGVLSRLSGDVGVISSSAWCQLPGDQILFLSRAGLYVYSQGAVSPFSLEQLPASFRNVDATETISLSYDVDREGVHISLVPSSGAGEHWWIDMRTKSFWPVSYGLDTLQPTALLPLRDTVSLSRRVMVGCQDGYVRYLSDSASDDDGTTITGYVVYGPVRAATALDRGIVTELVATTDRSAASVTWSLLTGDDAEDVVNNATTVATGTWSAGRNDMRCPRASSGAFGVKVSGTGLWAIETIGALVTESGRQR